MKDITFILHCIINPKLGFRIVLTPLDAESLSEVIHHHMLYSHL